MTERYNPIQISSAIGGNLSCVCFMCGRQYKPDDLIPRGAERSGKFLMAPTPICARCYHTYGLLPHALKAGQATAIWFDVARYSILPVYGLASADDYSPYLQETYNSPMYIFFDPGTGLPKLDPQLLFDKHRNIHVTQEGFMAVTGTGTIIVPWYRVTPISSLEDQLNHRLFFLRN